MTFAPENECAIVNALESIAKSLKNIENNQIVWEELKTELMNIRGAIMGER